MSFEDELNNFSNLVNERSEHIDTEETTKISLILPFIRLMGYDTEDPLEFKAEYTADIGAKRGEKIDFAILNNGVPEILIECKPVFNELSGENLSQLYRYFNITHARIGILTNGVVYRFYTDSKDKGKMDETPFLEVDLSHISPFELVQLERFRKENFNIDRILNVVNTLKYEHDIKKCLNEELEVPSDEFVRAISKQVYDGVLTKNKVQYFRKIIQKTFKEVINEKVDKSLKEAITINKKENEHLKPIEDNDIVTNKDELEGYYIIKAILEEKIDTRRVTLRDRKSYCGILLDDNQNYPIVRLHFNEKHNKKVSFFNEMKKGKYGEKIGNKIHINNVNELYQHKDKLQNTVIQYERLINKKRK